MCHSLRSATLFSSKTSAGGNDRTQKSSLLLRMIINASAEVILSLKRKAIPTVLIRLADVTVQNGCGVLFDSSDSYLNYIYLKIKET